MNGSNRVVPALLLVAALGAAACDDNTTPTEPTPPVSVTDKFSGPLTLNGATTHTFAVAAAGAVTATLTALEPEEDPPIAIGIALGTWNATTSFCTLIVANDQATKNALVSGSATGATTLCLRVSDAKGTLTKTVTYTVDVTHF